MMFSLLTTITLTLLVVSFEVFMRRHNKAHQDALVCVAGQVGKIGKIVKRRRRTA